MKRNKKKKKTIRLNADNSDIMQRDCLLKYSHCSCKPANSCVEINIVEGFESCKGKFTQGIFQIVTSRKKHRHN
jgi:hypothetical protein